MYILIIAFQNRMHIGKITHIDNFTQNNTAFSITYLAFRQNNMAVQPKLFIASNIYVIAEWLNKFGNKMEIHVGFSSH